MNKYLKSLSICVAISTSFMLTGSQVIHAEESNTTSTQVSPTAIPESSTSETANLADLKAAMLTNLNAAAQTFVDGHSGASQVPDFELATRFRQLRHRAERHCRRRHARFLHH